MPRRRPTAAPKLRLVVGPEEVYTGADYSDEERQFLIAVEQYKRRRRRPFPTWREVLHLVHALGYRKVADPRPPTPPAER